MGAFFRQLWALCWKNLLVLFQHPVLNLIRYFIFPIAFGVFIGEAQNLLVNSDFLGLGSPRPVKALSDVYDGSHPLYWSQSPGLVNSSPLGLTPEAIIEHMSTGFSDVQRQGFQKKDTPHDIAAACPQNFNGHSQCYAAIIFTSLPPSNAGLPVEDPINGLKIPNNISYTIQADAGLSHVDVRGQGDLELRHMPIQMALDHAIIALSTNMTLPVSKEWPFTHETNEFEADQIRLLYVSLIATLMILGLFIAYVGIAYTLPGAFASERANLLTAHLQASGLRDSARIMSWLIIQSLVYLPSWIIIGVIWQRKIFVNTSVLLVLAVNVINGVLLASHGLFLAVPFGKSPQLAAVTSIFGALVSAIVAWMLASGLFGTYINTGGAIIFSLFLPGGFYIFAMEAICNYELELTKPNILKGDPQNNIMILPLLIIALVDILLYPWLAIQLEQWLYNAHEPRASRSWNPFSRRSRTRRSEDSSASLPSNIAISIRNLSKVFKAPRLSKRKPVTAVTDLSFDVPKNGIFVLLGSNGAGKSTSLGIIGGLLGRTSGEIVFANGHGATGRPQRGDIGLVPQKNVLFDDLTCMQNLRVWQAVKRPAAENEEDLRQLLIDCDLEKKINAKAGTLSGGQKRKLQLAAGLVGGSSILLVDECTSGVDPLSRRALWKTLNNVRRNRTVIFTTHFLDEADLLGDMVAILASPGKLVAQGTPVELKSGLGSGYTLSITFEQSVSAEEEASRIAHIQRHILPVTPNCQTTPGQDHNTEYHLGTKDPKVVESVIRQVEHLRAQLGIQLLDVRGSSLESVFLGLMAKEESSLQSHKVAEDDKLDMKPLSGAATELPQLERTTSTDDILSPVKALNLTSGRPQSFISQTMTIFYKRMLVARRSWLTPLFAMVIATMGACASAGFVDKVIPGCDIDLKPRGLQPMFLRYSDFAGVVDNEFDDEDTGFKHGLELSVITSPPGILHTLGPVFTNVSTYDVSDTDAFSQIISNDFQNLSVGGFALDLGAGKDISQTQITFAYESTPGEVKSPVLLNLVNNILLNQGLNFTGKSTTAAGPVFILPSYQSFSFSQRSLAAIRWIVFFGLSMAVYPAFFSSYVAKERRSGVQAMQLSNGLTNPAGLWLGHLLFDGIFTVIISLVLVLVFDMTGHGFMGLGYLWFVLLLYGIAATLFSYCISLLVKTPLAAFAATAASQAVFFLLYLAGHLLILTYSQVSDADRDMTVLHFTMALLSPVGSLIRAAYVSINLFSTACGGGLGDISRYGGPILYLIGQSAFYFVILVLKDTGSLFRRHRTTKDSQMPAIRDEGAMMRVLREDVKTEAARLSASKDILKVMQVSKSFDGKMAVEDLTFGADRGIILALLGPNGAGKTTTFNMIRGDITPTTGQILVDGTSVVSQPRVARASLGVCPQFTAIDSQLSVAEHLAVYGRLKGLRSGTELESNIEQILHATGLATYRDRFASRLSGGNQRKLSLAIALMGNPAVLLIDEFSSGVDAHLKREMWSTLRAVSQGKALVITTHSMEEASALSNKVAIVATRMLAVGTTSDLEARYANYEVHFSARTREETLRARELMARVPGAQVVDDVATRFEVPIQHRTSSEGISLASLFAILAEQDLEFSVERPMLESVFLKVIRAHNVEEEERTVPSAWAKMKRMI